MIGAGDFNGDGRDDFLVRNANGQIGQWTGQADGRFVQNMSVNAMLDPAWHVAAIGDYNGDGRDDILLRNANYGFDEWLAQSNGSFVQNAAASTSIESSWTVQSPDIFLY